MQETQGLVFVPFRLDFQDERLWRGDEVVRLHRKSFAALCCLVTQAPQLVTKDVLLTAVWPETLVSEDVITVAIRQLRHVLGDRARLPQFIETVHGRGYRFIAPIHATTSLEERTVMAAGRDSAPRLRRRRAASVRAALHPVCVENQDTMPSTIGVL